MRVIQFPETIPHPRVMVVSHERSGTHFLMNTLANCFGYVVTPWLNYDYNSGLDVDFHDPEDVQKLFAKLAQLRLATLIKTHHSAPFFEDNIAFIAQHFRIFYIYRHPIATLRSFWKLIERFHWKEGPRGLSCNAFLRAPPMGYLMRYQMVQEPSMSHRWTSHVQGWLALARQYETILPVRYEALSADFATTVRSMEKFLQVKANTIERPPRDRQVIMDSTGIDYEKECQIHAADMQFMREAAGPLLDQLGYGTWKGNKPTGNQL